ncbi:uncharacterized protein LOC119837955 [Zerene cesonia]|uniref:uncharacterized protein LOC119837955 n=1 Tax=Zerene cesonia TaxID=33412 RepID=UPI0018E51081|nr:uncharacterized protein LOC119837955 [Zerene cesonia]
MNEKEVTTQVTISLKVPTIKTESGTQTITGEKEPAKRKEDTMDETMERPATSIRKRRNISKNRGQNARQREKTPEPSRASIPHEDTPTSDDEDLGPNRTSREIEADNTYEEMKRLVQERANEKDPVYDLDTDEILEARAMEANERRRRSISPFALPDKEEGTHLQRKGSFIDPTNKLLSTNYIVSPKDEDSKRRNSLTLASTEPIKSSRNSLSPPGTAGTSPKETEFPSSLPSTPKKLEEMVYPDEKTEEKPIDKQKLPKHKNKEEENANIEKEEKQIKKPSPVKGADIQTPTSGELVTRVIQVERTPSKKLNQDQKPVVEVRERVVRTPSKKLSAEAKPIINKQIQSKQQEPQSKVPPVKPARSKSASRFASKTSESEMSEDQMYQQSVNASGARRKVVPTPRRFIKHKSPRANRSHSVNRIEDVLVDKTGTGMSQTSLEIIELMQKARARSLSIPKEDPRIPPDYKKYSRTLQTPNKTPVNLRSTRGISCPKTIQIISDREILSGLASKKVEVGHKKHSRQSSGYVDASQSEYTSSCYSSSPSENEYEFDLLERSAELTRKLNLLSQREDKFDAKANIILHQGTFGDDYKDSKSVLRKRSILEAKKDSNISSKKEDTKKPKIEKDDKNVKPKLSRFKFIANWQQFKYEYRNDWEKLKILRNKCICDMLILIIMCGSGGMMFKSLEGSFENAYKCSARNVKRDFIESLWRGSHYLREDDWKSMARKKLFEFEDQLHTAHEAGVTSYSGQRSWNFMNSFVYCLTLITTIGYGHIAPKTTYGRVATIVYAIIGIPLFLIVLADFGKLFTRIIKFFWAFIRRFYYTRSCRRVRRTAPVQEVMKGLNIVYDVVRRPSQIFSEEDIETLPDGAAPPKVERKPSDVPPPLPPKPGQQKQSEIDGDPDTPAPSVFEIDDEFNLPISVAIFILVVYIIIGAVGYSIWETWNFFESFYFVFVSMSTIGLGDLVPDHPMFMMASILYLVFGLALTSMCINVVQVKLSDTFKQASAKLGATIGLKVAEEDGSLVPITPPPIEIAPVHKGKSEITEVKTVDSTDDAKNR